MSSFWRFLEEGKDEKRSQVKNNTISFNSFLTGISDDAFTVEQVLSIPVAKACTDIVTNSIKTLEVELYERVDDNTVIRVTDDYRLGLLNREPNLISTGVDFKAKLVQDLLLHGNAYIYVDREGNDIKALWNLNASDVSISQYVFKDNPFMTSGVEIKVQGRNELKLENVMIMTVSSDDGGLTGKGVISRGAKTIELALNEIELSKNIMSNGSAPINVVRIDKNLSKEAKDNLRSSWEAMYASAKNAGKLLILEQGMEYDKLSYSPAELGLTASRTITQANLCSLFGVPEAMIDSSANSYGNVESASIRLLQYSITPHINIIESALNRSLLLEKEKDRFFFKINTDPVLQTTQKERYEALKTGVDAGILSLNEARIRENLPPVDDDFIKLSLGSIMYDTKQRTYFVPNMSTVINANTKEIISSPMLAKEGIANNQIQKEEEEKEVVVNEKE